MEEEQGPDIMKDTKSLMIAIETIRAIMEGTTGDRNRAVYLIAREALKSWGKQV